MLKGSKRMKIIKGSKNRRELTQVKAISFSLRTNKQEILMYCGNKEYSLKNNVSRCVVCSEHRIDIINARSVRKGQISDLSRRLFLFGIKQKKFSRSHKEEPQRLFYKKAILGNFAIFTGNYPCWSLL